MGGIMAICVASDRSKRLQGFFEGVCFLTAVFFYLGMLNTMHTDLAKGVEEQPDEVRQLFHQLNWLTTITWSFYPLTVFLGRAHASVISPACEDILLSILDVLSKIGMEGLVVATCAASGAHCHDSLEVA